MILNYKVFGDGFPLVILHGLLGSLDNWQTIAKKLSEHYRVYIVDQRNHGKSPHSADFNYDLLAGDLREFYETHHISRAHLIGHSMGGKTVMQFALNYPELVAGLIVVDITPSLYRDQHQQVFQALFNAKAEKAHEREEVADSLRNTLKDETTVQFLMKGLVRDDIGKHFSWKFNLLSLYDNYGEISRSLNVLNPYSGPVLFIKGEKSNYINTVNYAELATLFPNHQLTEIKGSGHWVHADKPMEFTVEVERFLQSI